MTQDDLGPMPDAQVEPRVPNPGGVDAVEALDPEDDATVPDLSPDDNPAVEDKAPESLKESLQAGEDTSTEATRGDGGSDETGTESEESPA